VIRSPVVYTRATHFKNLGITGTPYPSLKFRLEIVGLLTLDPRRFILGSKKQIINYVKVFILLIYIEFLKGIEIGIGIGKKKILEWSAKLQASHP